MVWEFSLAEYHNPEFRNKADRFTWDPSQQLYEGEAGTSPDFLGWLMNWRDRTPQGALEEGEQATWRQAEAAARAIPTRDVSTLTARWADDGRTDDIEGMSERWWTSLHPASPDAASIMLALRDKLDAGTATAQERQLYEQTMGLAGNWSERASQPDPWNPLGDQLFGALGTLALGATGGLAGGALAAGGGLASTLGSLGTLGGVAGTGAGVVGQATDQDWLSNLGLALGAAGGLAGGAAGLANLAGTGVKSLGDAARLAQSAGRITGTAGRLSGNDALAQTGGYLGMAGGLGSGVDNLANLLSGTGGSLQGVLGLVRPLAGLTGRFLQPGQSGQPDQSGQSGPQRPVTAAPQRPLYGAPVAQPGMAAPGAGAGRIQALLQAARQAQQRGMQGPVQPSMSNQDWLRWGWQAPQAAPQSILGNL
jgi:hypothetical protein